MARDGPQHHRKKKSDIFRATCSLGNWVWVLSRGMKGSGCEVYLSLPFLARLRMCSLVPPQPHTPSSCGKIHFFVVRSKRNLNFLDIFSKNAQRSAFINS